MAEIKAQLFLSNKATYVNNLHDNNEIFCLFVFGF